MQFQNVAKYNNMILKIRIKGWWMTIRLSSQGNFSHQYFHTIRYKSHYHLIAQLLH